MPAHHQPEMFTNITFVPGIGSQLVCSYSACLETYLYSQGVCMCTICVCSVGESLARVVANYRAAKQLLYAVSVNDPHHHQGKMPVPTRG